MILKEMCKTIYSLLLGYTISLPYFVSVVCVSVIVEPFTTQLPIEVLIQTPDEYTFIRAEKDITKFINDNLHDLIPAHLLIGGVLDIRVVRHTKEK